MIGKKVIRKCLPQKTQNFWEICLEKPKYFCPDPRPRLTQISNQIDATGISISLAYIYIYSISLAYIYINIYIYSQGLSIYIYRVSEKTVQDYFYQNFVKFPSIITFGR